MRQSDPHPVITKNVRFLVEQTVCCRKTYENTIQPLKPYVDRTRTVQEVFQIPKCSAICCCMLL